ncbi:MAG: hypothetical protein QXR03_02715 [Candidatus Aenigmatarchaeota archaeon]
MWLDLKKLNEIYNGIVPKEYLTYHNSIPVSEIDCKNENGEICGKILHAVLPTGINVYYCEKINCGKECCSKFKNHFSNGFGGQIIPKEYKNELFINQKW